MTARAKRKPTPLRVPQQARSRQTRERILQAAVTSFEELGFEETNTAEIARRAGIGVGTLYGYFKDKRTLLLELLEGHVQEIADYVVRSLDPEAWREEDLRPNVRQLIDALFHIRRFNPGMQRILWERYFKDAEFRAAVEVIEQRVRTALTDLFEALLRDGRLRISDVSTSAFVIYTAIEWTASRLMLGTAGADLDATVEVASDMVSRFLFRDEPSRGARRHPA